MTKKLTPKQLAANVAAGKKPGRPEFVPTPEHRKQVSLLAGIGATQALIASLIKDTDGSAISIDTLTKHFRDELDTGMAAANAQVAKVMYQMATDGQHENSTKFWLERRAGWVPQVQLTGKDGEPLNPAPVPAVPLEDYKAALRDVMKEF